MPSAQEFIDSAMPPSEAFGFWSRLRWAVLGNNTGKFRSSVQAMMPIQQRLILIPGSLIEIAMEVPHLNMVISRGAEMFSMMDIKHVDKDGNDIENSAVLKFLRRPNVIQNRRQYLYEWYVQNAVHNKTFQFMLKGLSFELPIGMWNLPPGNIKINTTGKIFRQTKITDIIESYEDWTDSSTYAVDRVIYMSEGIGKNLLNPISKVEALQIPLANIQATLKARNQIITEKGMLGMIMPEIVKDADGQLPFDDLEHERVRKEYQQKYGLDSMTGHVAFPKVPMKWVPMSFDVNQLGLAAGLEDDFSQIIAAYGLDRDIFPSVKGATFENKQAGMKQSYQMAIQPLADKFVEKHTEALLTIEEVDRGERLEASYMHLPVMKKDERVAAQAKYFLVKATSQALHDGTISHDQMAAILEWEPDGDKKIITTGTGAQDNNPGDGKDNQLS